MSGQLELFAWADARPSNVVDAMPALIRKAALETTRPPQPPKEAGQIVALQRKMVTSVKPTNPPKRRSA